MVILNTGDDIKVEAPDGTLVAIENDTRGVKIGVYCRGHPDINAYTVITTDQAWDIMLALQRMLAYKA